eukprot:scaffold265642_cov19-Prasinocladus_malaysianus.AAC.1
MSTREAALKRCGPTLMTTWLLCRCSGPLVGKMRGHYYEDSKMHPLSVGLSFDGGHTWYKALPQLLIPSKLSINMSQKIV